MTEQEARQQLQCTDEPRSGVSCGLGLPVGHMNTPEHGCCLAQTSVVWVMGGKAAKFPLISTGL